MRLPRLLPPLLLAALITGLDQASKIWMKALLLEPEPQQIVLTRFFNLTPAWNYGVSFSLFYDRSGDNAWILAAVAGVVTLGLLVWLWRAQGIFLRGGLGLVIGGAIGNLIDRIAFGAVFDFLDAHLLGYHWPAFNLADSAICIGVGLIMIDATRSRAQKPAAQS